ncbi:hypothetical protein ACNQKP_18100 [Bdellovibrio bacteriovorus]|uniref:hypothetical protein n=1 Tax=Bdellovibrio bacteriovorus TaxID=959 RepID=UPI003AA993A5
MNKTVILLIVILFHSVSFAGFGTDWADRGNGGDVIVCQKDGYTMYDIYEAEKRYGLKPQFLTVIPAGEGDTVEEKWEMTVKVTQNLIDRLKDIDRARWEKYSQWLQTFEEESRFVGNAELFDVPDTGIGFIPPGCELKQLVIQRDPKFPHDRRYIIAMDHWWWLEPQDAAAAVMHELLYREVAALRPEVRTSEALRYFNALILSNKISELTPSEYLELIRRVF